MPEFALKTDVLIIGAGPVGMTLALALAGGAQRVLLVDRRPRGAWADDPRALALSHGSRQLLERIKAWNARAATAIRQIHVSQRGGFGRTLIDADDYDTPALGYVMRYSDLADELDARLGSDQILAPCTVDTIETDGDEAVVTVTNEGRSRRINARLVVHAEGTPDNEADVKVRDYRQHAVVAEVSTTTGHQLRAWERFTPDGPLALLPLDDGYSIVFTVPPEKAERLLAMDDAAFLAALREQFGRRLEFTACRARASFPLALRVRSPLVSRRQVWIGNAAQSLHPVSGQGFNLGLRDACELAEILHRHSDAGDPAALASYARGRGIDRRGSIAFTDGIVRLFSNDIAPLRLARGLGLLALDLTPPLRHFVARRMIWGARAWL
jgi:2-octaprenyl-6-methoxyphenol hydroxylase